MLYQSSFKDVRYLDSLTENLVDREIDIYIERKKFIKTNDVLTKLLIFIDKIMELQNPLINIIFNGTTLLCSWIGISLLSADSTFFFVSTSAQKVISNPALWRLCFLKTCSVKRWLPGLFTPGDGCLIPTAAQHLKASSWHA